MLRLIKSLVSVGLLMSCFAHPMNPPKKSNPSSQSAASAAPSKPQRTHRPDHHDRSKGYAQTMLLKDQYLKAHELRPADPGNHVTVSHAADGTPNIQIVRTDRQNHQAEPKAQATPKPSHQPDPTPKPSPMLPQPVLPPREANLDPNQFRNQHGFKTPGLYTLRDRAKEAEIELYTEELLRQEAIKEAALKECRERNLPIPIEYQEPSKSADAQSESYYGHGSFFNYAISGFDSRSPEQRQEDHDRKEHKKAVRAQHDREYKEAREWSLNREKERQDKLKELERENPEKFKQDRLNKEREDQEILKRNNRAIYESRKSGDKGPLVYKTPIKTPAPSETSPLSEKIKEKTHKEKPAAPQKEKDQPKSSSQSDAQAASEKKAPANPAPKAAKKAASQQTQVKAQKKLPVAHPTIAEPEKKQDIAKKAETGHIIPDKSPIKQVKKSAPIANQANPSKPLAEKPAPAHQAAPSKPTTEKLDPEVSKPLDPQPKASTPEPSPTPAEPTPVVSQSFAKEVQIVSQPAPVSAAIQAKPKSPIQEPIAAQSTKPSIPHSQSTKPACKPVRAVPEQEPSYSQESTSFFDNEGGMEKDENPLAQQPNVPFEETTMGKVYSWLFPQKKTNMNDKTTTPTKSTLPNSGIHCSGFSNWGLQNGFILPHDYRTSSIATAPGIAHNIYTSIPRNKIMLDAIMHNPNSKRICEAVDTSWRNFRNKPGIEQAKTAAQVAAELGITTAAYYAGIGSLKYIPNVYKACSNSAKVFMLGTYLRWAIERGNLVTIKDVTMSEEAARIVQPLVNNLKLIDPSQIKNFLDAQGYAYASMEGAAVQQVTRLFGPGGNVIVQKADKAPRIFEQTKSVVGEKLFDFSYKAGSRMDEPGRRIPLQIIDEIIKKPMHVAPDPDKSEALMYYSKMWRDGKLYNVEVLYNEKTKQIWHFLYKQEALGPLPEIK